MRQLPTHIALHMLQGSTDGLSYTDVTECVAQPDSLQIDGLPYTHYRARTCVPQRLDVCSESPSKSVDIAVLVCFCIRRQEGRLYVTGVGASYSLVFLYSATAYYGQCSCLR